MKKKLLLGTLLATTSLALSGCNKQLLDFQYEFNKVHIYSEDKCFDLKKWTDYDGEQL